MTDELKAYISAKIEYEIASHLDTYHSGCTPDRSALDAAEKALEREGGDGDYWSREDQDGLVLLADEVKRLRELPFATAGVERPKVVIDLAGAIITQVALDTLVDLLKNSSNDYGCVDIIMQRVNRNYGVPRLTVEWPMI